MKHGQGPSWLYVVVFALAAPVSALFLVLLHCNVPSGKWWSFKVLHTFTLLSNQFNHYGICNKITSITWEKNKDGRIESKESAGRERENFYSIVDSVICSFAALHSFLALAN